MNLGIVIPQLEKYGGAERFLVECLRLWQYRHDITLYATVIKDEMLREHGVTDVVTRSTLTGYFQGEHSMLLNALLLPKIWKEEIGRHELYHTHLWPAHLIDLHPMVWYPHEPLRVLHDLRFEHNVEHVGQAASRNLHIYPKYNYDRIGDVTYEAYLAAIESTDKSSRPERIVANSQYSARYLEQVYDRPIKDVVYPGVTPEDFIGLPSDPNLFVTVSQLWAHKRVNLLIEAVALVDNAQLMIIGNGPEREALKSLSRKLGVANRVFILSGLTNQELRLVLARANAMVFAPVNEPFGIVVLEAMAAGKPIIAVDQGGYVEVCKPEFSFLLPPFPGAFAERMAYLQANPSEARRMGQASRAAVGAFTWARAADQLEDIIEAVHGEMAAAQHRVENGPERTLFGIQYYLWYGDGFGAAHWNDDPRSGYVGDRPLLGYYSSTKGQTISYHLEIFEKMKLDYVILNLHIDENGVNGLELIAIQHVFDIALRRDSPLKFVVQLAPYITDPTEVERIVGVVRKLYASHPNYLTLKGQPALFWFWSSGLDANKSVLASFRSASEGFCNIAASLRLPAPDEERKTFGLFSGFAPFSPLELSADKNWERTWSAGYAGAERAGMAWRVATISPGYDDTALDDDRRFGNPFRRVQRQEGKTYRRSLDFLRKLTPRPDLVMISTFNELHENTHIEPTQAHGMRYIEMTQSFIAEWREMEVAHE